MRLHLKYSYVGAYGEDLFDRDTMHKLYAWNDLCISIDRAKKIPLFQYDEESMEELADAVADHEEDVDDYLKPAKSVSNKEFDRRIKELEKQMREAARLYDFETAARLRDIIIEAKAERNS